MVYTYIQLLIIIIIPYSNTYAQWYNPYNVLPKAVNSYNKGIAKAQDNALSEAVPLLEKAIQEDPKYIDAYLSLAGVLGELKQYNASCTQYSKAIRLDSVYTRPYLLPYSINLAGTGNFAAAMAAANQFVVTKGLNNKSIQSAQYRIRCYQFALDFAKQYPSNYAFNPINLGDSINTAESEYFPSITIDNKQLIYTRRVNDNNEDFFESTYSNGKWSLATPIPGDVNTTNNEGAQHISQDGSILFFTGCNFANGNGSCDIYYSLYLNGSYTKPINAGRNINTEYWETQPSLSADKKNLYFVARDPSTIGGSDIYMSTLSDKGKWGVPLNLGKTINTTGNESCPYIHPDNETLYFTSDGHPGYGGEDLYLSRKDSAGKWGKPINLGYPINTIENEGSLVIAANGSTAYCASDRALGKGGLDLYTFTLRPEMQPTKTLFVKGKVIDSITQKGISSIIELIDLNKKNLVQKIQTDDAGNYLITLPVGKNYMFNVYKQGYLFYSNNYTLTSNNIKDTSYTNNIALQPLIKGASIVLNNVFFDNNKFVLKPESAVELDKLTILLKDNPTLVIELAGYTDNVGNANTNLLLSKNRAQAVAQYLIAKGVVKSKLVPKGYGAAKPRVSNATEAGRAMNRRTEVIIVSK